MSDKTAGGAHEDLAFVREAVNRQRSLLCGLMPMWFAAVIAVNLVVGVGGPDFIEQPLRPALHGITTAAFIVGLLVVIFRQRKQIKAGEVMPLVSREAQRRLFLPWAGPIAGLLLLFAAKSELGLSGEAFGVSLLILMGASFFAAGAGTLYTLAGFGVGTLFGAGVMIYGLPLPHLSLGILMGAGVLIGNWLDHRRVREG